MTTGLQAKRPLDPLAFKAALIHLSARFRLSGSKTFVYSTSRPENQFQIRMKICIQIILTATLCLGLAPSFAQTAAAPKTTDYFGGFTDKLFGSNVSYSAVMELQTGKAKPVVAQTFFDEGKSRQEMDLAALLPSGLGLQKDGAGKYIQLFLPDKRAFYQVHPEIRGYLEMPFSQPPTVQRESDYRMDLTPSGKETLDGHACIKNKTVVTDSLGHQKGYTVWNASDLNQFPVKIQTTNSLGESETTFYRNVKLAKPDAKLFELPAGYRKYTDLAAMMQDIMMKQMQGMGR